MKFTNESRRKQLFPNVSDADWNDWHWQVANRAETLEDLKKYIELTPEFSIYEIPTPPAWVGRTIVQLAVRSRYHISILATRTGERIAPLPGADHELRADERLILMGSNKDVRKIL